MLSSAFTIPAKNTIACGEDLNLLGGIVNRSEEAVTAVIRVWARLYDEWKPVLSKEEEIAAGEHKHVYYTLPFAALKDAFPGEEIEEVEVYISDSMPDPKTNGELILVD